jgi:ankyrin repeat protein
MEDTAKACLQITEKNQLIADEIRKFVLPFDKAFANSYFRFDNPYTNTFFEHVQRDKIDEDVKGWAKGPQSATQCAIASNVLRSNAFPDSPEDLLALASLGSLLRSLSVAGYARESLIVNDIITNYILYESSWGNDGSFRKLCLAAELEMLSSSILGRHEMQADESQISIPIDLRSEAAILNGLGAFGDQIKGGYRVPGQLQTVFDYVSAAYSCLVVLQERNPSLLDNPTFSRHFQQLSFISELPSASDPGIIEKMEDLLRLAAVAALCDAAVVQQLHGVKGLSYNGSLIRQVRHILLTIPYNGIGEVIIGPIANMFSMLMETNNWSSFRDDTIPILLKVRKSGNEFWSLVNLALKCCRNVDSNASRPSNGNNAYSECLEFLHAHSTVWQAKRENMIISSVQNGWFELIDKSLSAEELISEAHFERAADFGNQSATAFRMAAQAGYPYVMKRMLESTGIQYCKGLANRPGDQGLAAMHLACKYRAPQEVFRLLQILDGNVNLKTDSGRTPLSYCFPDQKQVPSVFQNILDLVSEFALPTSAPLDRPKAYGGHDNGKPIDTRTSDFRSIINLLICRNADISIADDHGLTPLHRAAREGWGDNLDVFFMYSHGDLEVLQKDCLTLQDSTDRTVLDYSRRAGNRGLIQGGEDIITAEMAKRGLRVPPKININTAPVDDMQFTYPMSRPRLPTPEPSVESSYMPPSNSSSTNPSPQPQSTRFPPPQVYQDPATASNQNRNTPSPLPMFPPPQVYVDQSYTSKVQPTNPNQAQAQTQYSPPQTFHNQNALPQPSSAYPAQSAQAQYRHPPTVPTQSIPASPHNQNQSYYSQPSSNQAPMPPQVTQEPIPMPIRNPIRASGSQSVSPVGEASGRVKETKRSKFLGKFTSKS